MRGFIGLGCALLATPLACSSSSSGGATVDPHVDLPSAHVLVADQFNNRVLELDRQGGVHWSFGDGASTPGPHSVVGPNDAERLADGRTLISGTGAPQGQDPSCNVATGCEDNRVLLVDGSGTITWEYGKAGSDAGADGDPFVGPVCARMLPSGNVLVTDQGHARVVEITPAKTVAWQYPPSLDGGSPLSGPNSAERLPNGNTLIADEGNNRVVEVDAAGNLVWQYPGTDAGVGSSIGYVAFASRLANGNTLITDGMHARILEVTPGLAVVWSYVTSKRAGSNANPQPSRALRLSNGDTLVSDQFNQQVIEVDAQGNVVWSYGKLDVAGANAGQLNAPYDAKVIGDFTGLTAP